MTITKKNCEIINNKWGFAFINNNIIIIIIII
jgi:hypothetical protein